MGHKPIAIDLINSQAKPFIFVETDEQGNLVQEKWDRGLDDLVYASSYYAKIMPPGANSFTKDSYLEKVKLEVYITDSRVIFRCLKYNKRGIDIATTPLELLYNFGSRAIAAQMRKGKVLLGQVRYEWIQQIHYRKKYNWLSKDTLMLVYTDTDKNMWSFEIGFTNGTDLPHLANNILKRASRYRMAMQGEKGEKEKQFYIDFSEGGTIKPAAGPKETSFIILPNHCLAPLGEDKRPDW